MDSDKNRGKQQMNRMRMKNRKTGKNNNIEKPDGALCYQQCSDFHKLCQFIANELLQILQCAKSI